jgi:hypothetical protein
VDPSANHIQFLSGIGMWGNTHLSFGNPHFDLGGGSDLSALAEGD